MVMVHVVRCVIWSSTVCDLNVHGWVSSAGAGHVSGVGVDGATGV